MKKSCKSVIFLWWENWHLKKNGIGRVCETTKQMKHSTSVFKIIGKKNYHEINSAQRSCYVYLWHIVTGNMQYYDWTPSINLIIAFCLIFSWWNTNFWKLLELFFGIVRHFQDQYLKFKHFISCSKALFEHKNNCQTFNYGSKKGQKISKIFNLEVFQSAACFVQLVGQNIFGWTK